MIRMAMWLGLWLLTFGAADIEVDYDDGLHIKFTGWLGRIGRKK